MANKLNKSADGLGSAASDVAELTDTITEPGTGNDGSDGSDGKANSGAGKSNSENAAIGGKLGKSFEAVAGAKRKRGRPKGSATKSAARPDAEPKEGLGLKDGAKPKPRPPTRDEITGLSALVTMAANFAAMNNNAQDFVITPQEGERIAGPLAEVLAEWGIYLSPGESPYVKLASALIGVYGLRVLARYQATKAPPRNSPEQPANGNSASPTFDMDLPTLNETEAEAAARQRAA